VPSESRAPRLCAVLGVGVLIAGTVVCNAMPSEARRPDDAAIAAAVTKLQADPNLASEHKVKRLRWAGKTQEPKPSGGLPGWLDWIRNLFGWLAETSRLLLWVICILLVAALGLYVYRFLGTRTQRRVIPKASVPNHVRDLDIRPESLPDDIGAAALALWERGEQRAALSLLYRGLLSRLVHVYTLPLRDSSTEGDCMELASGQLDDARSAYVSRVVRTWQHCVYGGIGPSTAEVRALCGDFRL
jgi:hypothetical protein